MWITGMYFICAISFTEQLKSASPFMILHCTCACDLSLVWYKFLYMFYWVPMIWIISFLLLSYKYKLHSFLSLATTTVTRFVKQPTLLVLECLKFVASTICIGQFAGVSYCSVAWGCLRGNLAICCILKNKSTSGSLKTLQKLLICWTKANFEVGNISC